MRFKISLTFISLTLVVFILLSKLTSIKTNQTASLKSAFNFSHIFLKPSPTPVPTVNLGLVGDLGLGRVITYKARTLNDFNYSFKKISPWLVQNDFNLANLESPIINNCPTANYSTFKFCGDPRFLPYLNQNKFILNLANNHILNYGQDGLSQTKTYLDKLNINYVYSHQPQTEFLKHTYNNITFGFIGLDLTRTTKADNNTIIDLVKKYSPQVDWLIVSLHWGAEYKLKPESWRVDFAHRLVDAGADIIHGHHPHVYQDYEIYNHKPIFYSLGNFVFDQNWSTATSQSNIIRLNLDKTNIIDIQKFPIQIKYNSQPNLID